MVYKVLGFEVVDYVNKSGNQVQGTRLFLSYESDKFIGLGCEVVFIGKKVNVDVEIDDKIKLLYNKYGKVDELLIVS